MNAQYRVSRVGTGLTLATLLAFGASGLTACGGGEEAREAAPREPVRVAAPTALAHVEPTPRNLLATGAVEPLRQAEPGTKILGRVAVVAVREGAKVAKGQTLAQLEDRDLRAALDQARAGVAMAQAQLENADAQFRRMQELYSRGSVTAKNLEDATAGKRVGKAALEQAQAGRQAAEVMLGYAKVESPFAGWVIGKRVEVGDLVQPGQPMFVVADLDPVKIVVDVPGAEVHLLEVGAAAQVEVDAASGPAEATIDRILPAGDRATRTFEVQLLVANPEGRLKPGMFARALFELGSAEALFVPAGALVERGQLQGIFVVDADGRARLRWVRVGETRGERLEILSGLADGERIVTEVPPGLVDGAIVDGASANVEARP